MTHRTVGVRFAGHATVLLSLPGVRVVTDPFLRPTLGPLRRHGTHPDPDEMRADVVVISHGHPDHFDPASLAALPGRPAVVVPRGLGAATRRAVPRLEVLELGAGGRLRLGGLEVRATPARHWLAPVGPRARPIGYVLDAGPTVYFAGDTGPMPSLPSEVGPVDLALLPIWTWGPHLGPGHLGPLTAAELASALGPRAVVPIHWGTLYPRGLARVWGPPLERPARRFVRHAARLAPGVDVRVLEPGASTTFRF